MSTINLLYADRYNINDNIHIMIPTVGEVLDNEDNYYSMVSLLTAMPIDLMCELDDIGVDFTSINDYDLFLISSFSLKKMDTSLIFGDLDFNSFEIGYNKQNSKPVLFSPETGVVIDRAIFGQIAATLRKLHHIEKNNRKPANDEAKEYMIHRARQKMARKKNKSEFSQLESLIIAMVNTEQYKYNFEETRNLSIYQFNESTQQVIKKVDYEHKMLGVYSGTIDPKGLSQNDLNWLVH